MLAENDLRSIRLEPQRFTFELTMDCRYLVEEPLQMPKSPVVVVALHGYAMDAKSMIALVRPAFGRLGPVVALEAPHAFYLGTPGTSKVGYNWGVSAHWESTTRMHHQMVLRVLDDCRHRYGLGAERTALIGFSQPVGLNYRFCATYPGAVHGVIGVCGGIPRDWEDPKYQQVEAAVLHISRSEDEYYPLDIARQFELRLQRRARDVEFRMLPGGHRFPSNSVEVFSPWIQRVFGVDVESLSPL